jgi:hypothetical protein
VAGNADTTHVDPATLFAWLRTQPFIMSGPAGLYPNDTVREMLDNDLRACAIRPPTNKCTAGLQSSCRKSRCASNSTVHG